MPLANEMIVIKEEIITGRVASLTAPRDRLAPHRKKKPNTLNNKIKPN